MSQSDRERAEGFLPSVIMFVSRFYGVRGDNTAQKALGALAVAEPDILALLG